MTMLAISVRDRPCRARTGPSSVGRVTWRTVSSLTTWIGSATVSFSSPLGPLTLTAWPSIAMSTPLGMGMGRRPMRDMLLSPFPLPDVGEDFPAYPVLLSLPVARQAGRRRDDRHAEPAEHPGQVVLLRVHAQAGLGHPLDPGDRALPGVAELQQDHQVLADFGVLDAPPGDVALLLEDLRDVRLDLRVRHAHGVVVRRVGVPHTGQHVRNRVGH